MRTAWLLAETRHGVFQPWVVGVCTAAGWCQHPAHDLQPIRPRAPRPRAGAGQPRGAPGGWAGGCGLQGRGLLDQLPTCWSWRLSGLLKSRLGLAGTGCAWGVTQCGSALSQVPPSTSCSSGGGCEWAACGHGGGLPVLPQDLRGSGGGWPLLQWPGAGSVSGPSSWVGSTLCCLQRLGRKCPLHPLNPRFLHILHSSVP